MPDHKIGTREEWQTARDELSKLEAEHAELGQRVTEQRRQLPWVPVEKEYQFDTEQGKKTLAELFDGRSQLLAYNIMFGPDYELGACPGCSNLGDELDATRVHLNHRDVTLICFSRAPIDRLIAYKKPMGWQFPYVSTNGKDFPFDLGSPSRASGRRRSPSQGNDRRAPRVAGGLGATGRSQARGRPARGPELHRLRARERERLPHLHGDGTRSVCRALPLVPAQANAEARTRGAPRLAQGRVPGLIAGGTLAYAAAEPETVLTYIEGEKEEMPPRPPTRRADLPRFLREYPPGVALSRQWPGSPKRADTVGTEGIEDVIQARTERVLVVEASAPGVGWP